MSIELNVSKILAQVYKPTYKLADNSSFTLFDLGIVKEEILTSASDFTFIRRRNPGGVMNLRAPGEHILMDNSSLTYDKEEWGTHSFSTGDEANLGYILHYQNPESLNPESLDSIARVASAQIQTCLTRLANTMKLMACCAVLPSVTIDGNTFTNDRIDTSWTLTPSGDWSSAGTDIIGQLKHIMLNFHGTNIPAVDGITVLLSRKQMNNITNNTGFLAQVGSATGASIAPQHVPFELVQRVFAGYGISLQLFDDQYYSTNNSTTHENLTSFLDSDYIVVLPRAVYTDGGMGRPRTLLNGANGHPFLHILLAPDPDFLFTNRTNTSIVPGLRGGMVRVPGAYMWTGTEQVTAGEPNKLKTVIAVRMGYITAHDLNVKYIEVQS